MKWSLPLVLNFTTLFPFVLSQAPQNGTNQPTISAPHTNQWKALSVEEIALVNKVLQEKFNLTGNSGSSFDSFVYQITLNQPNKTDVVPFLDNDAEEPARYARATVAFGDEDLHWQEYLVGPLVGWNSTGVEPLTYPFHNEHPGKTKVHPLYALNDATLFQLNLDAEIANITKKLWNATVVEGTVFLRFGVPFWEEDGRLVSWAAFIGTPLSDVTSLTLLPLGVWLKFDFTSRNWTEWTTAGWYSQGKFYNSTAEFQTAVFSPDFKKPPPNVDGNWTSTDRQGDPFPLDQQPPPASSQLNQRFKIDDSEGYICWMDFCFYTSVAWDVGLSLFDIQYKGKRLIYELSLQEALTTYAGSDPFASQTTFWDTITGLGSTLVPLVRGYDCPAHATYLNATFADRNSTKTQADAICVFEYDAGYPIRRHSSLPIYTSVAKNIVFTIRTISTVGNYDFMIEYNFFYDGAIEVSVRASGYISATYWEGNLEYGFHIHDYLSGSLHDHVLTFKADFDVLGTKNTLQKIEFVPESTVYPWSNGKVHDTFKATRSLIANESEASIKWSQNDAAIYAIANTEFPNKFGEFPAYRIKRNAGTTHLTTKNSTSTIKAAAFTNHDFYITKQKDTEPRAIDPWNQFIPQDPLVNFAKFFDDESLDQEDLVLWINLGMHHIPHTGDLPNTMFTAAHSAVRFEPFNYLDSDPSVASYQQIRVNYNEDLSVESVDNFPEIVVNGTSG